MRQTIEEVDGISEHFKNGWFFDSREMQNLIKKMSQKDQELFLCDPKKVDFLKESQMLMYGIQRYYNNQDVP